MNTFRVRIEDVLMPPNVPAGMNPLVVMGLAYTLRSTNEDPPPIEVRREGSVWWRISNGRHRFMAAVIAGRSDVLATEVF